MPENKEPPVRGVKAFFLRLSILGSEGSERNENKKVRKIARNREEAEKMDDNVPFSSLMHE